MVSRLGSSSERTEVRRSVRDWIEAGRRGEQRGIDELCRYYQPMLLRYVQHLMRGQARRWGDPNDIVQVTLGSVLCALPRTPELLDEVDLLKRLRRTAKWRIFDAARRHRTDVGDSHVAPPLADPAQDAPSTGPVTLDDQASWLHRLIDQLPPHYKEVVRLRALDGLEFAEVGKRLGLEPDAARMRFRRAIDELRERLRGRPENPD
jgi:RNA polymerase sigma factor (sigma-70 family)